MMVCAQLTFFFTTSSGWTFAGTLVSCLRPCKSTCISRIVQTTSSYNDTCSYSCHSGCRLVRSAFPLGDPMMFDLPSWPLIFSTLLTFPPLFLLGASRENLGFKCSKIIPFDTMWELKEEVYSTKIVPFHMMRGLKEVFIRPLCPPSQLTAPATQFLFYIKSSIPLIWFMLISSLMNIFN